MQTSTGTHRHAQARTNTQTVISTRTDTQDKCADLEGSPLALNAEFSASVPVKSPSNCVIRPEARTPNKQTRAGAWTHASAHTHTHTHAHTNTQGQGLKRYTRTMRAHSINLS